MIINAICWKTSLNLNALVPREENQRKLIYDYIIRLCYNPTPVVGAGLMLCL
jgi:hypothetical protein